MDDADHATKRPGSGKAQRVGDEAPYTSEVQEVTGDVGTDSPLDGPAPDGSTDQIRDHNGTPMENPSG